jgi:predicted dehydrogenase
MNKVRLAFVGLGAMGQCAHLRNYVNRSDCEIVAAAEPRPQLGEMVGRRYGIPRLYRDHRELLAAEHELDGIVAIQQFQGHGAILPELLERHVPVLIEKPLAGSVDVGERILEVQRRTGTPLYIGYHKRSDPATMHALRVIEQWRQSGRFGRLTYLRITMPPGDWMAAGFCGLIRSDEPAAPIRHDRRPSDMDEATYRQYEGFVNYYIHQVNLLRHLLGEPYEVRYADPSGVLLAGASRGGVAVTLEMAPYHTTIDWQEQAFIAFERGWMRLELPPPMALDRAGRLVIYEDPGDGLPRTIIPQMPHVHAMGQQAVHFLQAIRGERTCLCEPEEALQDLHIAREYIRLRPQAQSL